MSNCCDIKIKRDFCTNKFPNLLTVDDFHHGCREVFKAVVNFISMFFLCQGWAHSVDLITQLSLHFQHDISKSTFYVKTPR